MSLRSLRYLSSLMEDVVVPTPEEGTTLVNETTTRVDPNVPEVGEPIEPAPQAPVDAPVDAPVEPSVELPAEVTPAEVEDVKEEVDETIEQVEDEGVTPSSMRYIQRMYGNVMHMLNIPFPSIYEVKDSSLNLKVSNEVVKALKTLKYYLSHFRTY